MDGNEFEARIRRQRCEDRGPLERSWGVNSVYLPLYL